MTSKLPKPPTPNNSSTRPGTANSTVAISSISSVHSNNTSQNQQQQFSLWRDRPTSSSSVIGNTRSGMLNSTLPPRRPNTVGNDGSSINENSQQHQQNSSSSVLQSQIYQQQSHLHQAQFLRSTVAGFASSTKAHANKSKVIGSDTNLDEMFGSVSASTLLRPGTSSNNTSKKHTSVFHANMNGNDHPPQHHHHSSAASTTSSGDQNTTVGFRSPCVSIQVALHEIAANVLPKGTPPDSNRARRVLELLRNTASLCNDPIMSHVLHVLSLELHRCIFGPSQTTIKKFTTNLLSAAGSGPGSAPPVDLGEDDDDIPYFDQLEEVSREHRLLLAELNAVENTNRQDQMAAELERFRQVVPFYEHEIARLTREGSKKGEETEGLRDELGVLQRIHEKAIVDFEVQNKLLLKDVRELQVRLFQVSKNAIETEAGEEMYQMLKTTKSEQLHGLFEQCNERASVSLFMIQIEFLINTVLSRHDAAILNAPPRRWSQLVINFRIHDTECLLEEYNHLADRREQLDELDKVEYTDHKSAKGPASSNCTMRTPVEIRKQQKKEKEQEKEQQKKQKTSIKRAQQMFGERISASTKDPNDFLRANKHFGANVQAFHRNAVQPLLELTATKRFRTNVEVHVETTGGDENLLKTVHTVNPLQILKLPQRTNYVKLKFLNPMLKNPARNFGDDDRDFLVEETIKSGANVMDWLPDNSAFASSYHDQDQNTGDEKQKISNQKKSPQRNALSSSSPINSPTSKSGSPVSFLSPASLLSHSNSALPNNFSLMGSPTRQQQQQQNESLVFDPPKISIVSNKPTIWDEFRTRFGDYHPAVPRSLRVDLCDLHMCRAFVSFRKKILRKFDTTIEVALKSGAETLDSATYIALREAYDSFSHRTLQASLFDALEELYIYPELVMKVAYELLTAMEILVDQQRAPHFEIYIRALSGQINPFYANFIAIVNYKLGANWPQPTLREDDPKGAIPANDVLALFSMIFPNADTELFRTDAVPSVEPFLEQFLGGVVQAEPQTLACVRRFLNQAITEQSDPWSTKISEAVTFYAEETQWSQLDAEGTFQAVKNILSTSTTSATSKNSGTLSQQRTSRNSGRAKHQQQHRGNNNNDGTELKNQMMLHQMWACATMGVENRLPLSESTRIVTEMVAVATHAAAIEMQEDYENQM